MKLLFSRGTLTLTLSLTFAFAASAAINERGRGKDLLIDENMNMPRFKPYDSGSIKTLIVSYRDEAAHEKVVAHTTAMVSEGRAIEEASNIVFSKQHKISSKAGKARRARGLQDDRDDLAFDSAKGVSIVSVDTATENFDDEVTALENIEGVSCVEENHPMHIFSTDMKHEQNLRGVKAADHISEIQDAMKAAADALPVPEDKIDYSPSHEGRGRRLAEDVPYGIGMVNASWVWDQDQSSAMVDPIKICVVDTGYDPNHQDLPNEADHNVIGHVGEDTSASGPNMGQWNIDGNGHGTHCAGTIGAIGDNEIGVTSVNPDPSKFQFIIGKGLSDSGSGTGATVMSAVEQCVTKGAKVISMSLGGGGISEIQESKYKGYYDDGVLIIAAAGNSGNSAKLYPASYPVVMSVGSVTSTRVHSSFSQFNEQVEIAAPGTAVLSTLPDNKYGSMSGTSMATPHVAGVAALLWSHFPDCTNNQIRNAMIHSTASDGWNSKYGWGIVNAGHAYELLKTGCETAGGVGTPLHGQGLSDIANGGKDQKNVGCTLDAHCDQSNFCDTETSECVAAPPTPTPPPTVPPPCPSGEKRYQVTVTADNYPTETSYTLKNLCSDATILADSVLDAAVANVSEAKCAPAQKMQFVIKDSYGDGICCGYGSGSFKVTENDIVKAEGGEFESEVQETWGWVDCDSPPTTSAPTTSPTVVPTSPPTTSAPTTSPTVVPTSPPTTSAPTTSAPTTSPTVVPTSSPTTSPTVVPTSSPTTSPTVVPTSPPTALPTNTNAPTPNPTVPVTLPPTSGDNAVAQEAVYDTTLSVPRCANTGSSCDSLSLLNGKGSMTNGQEPNASNTNKSGPVCNDGNSGSYHSDESIDQITVTAGDLDASGNPSPSGDFIVEGGRAYVTVKLWCWGTGASDRADLYLSSTASSPDWQLLTTITCPGGGAQTIRHAFDVPSGNVQSIRVNFRYGGTNPSTCSNGGYDDHDDLVFAVKSSSGTPPPTPSPPTGGPSGPQTATFDESLEAPKCSYGSRCDSGDLLNGRALIINGNEPNTPNTLNECSDGSVGTYHSDESVDKIVVSRADGGSGDFTEGDEVTITATVFCWSSGSSDYIDFYYAQNANSPAWMTIAIRERCPGGQVQTVSRNLVLQSAGLQAVRVNLMYGTGSAGTNKCTSGNYDDTDDLVISVRPNAMASMITSGKDKKDDEVQGAIVEVQHDKRADDAAAALVQLNSNIRAADAEDESSSSKKSKKSKSDKEAVVSANAVSATSKYVCQKHKPFDANICANGVAKDNRCSYHGQSCGRKGKQCYFAECADYEGAD